MEREQRGLKTTDTLKMTKMTWVRSFVIEFPESLREMPEYSPSICTFVMTMEYSKSIFSISIPEYYTLCKVVTVGYVQGLASGILPRRVKCSLSRAHYLVYWRDETRRDETRRDETRL